MASKSEPGYVSKTSRHRVAKDQRSSALVRELTDAFRFFDLNGDGKLSVQEMAIVVRSLSADSVAEADLLTLIRGVDGDGDGCLDLHEFIDLNTRAIDQSRAGTTAENDALMAAFNQFDTDRDGFISAEELHNVLVGFGDQTYSLEECRGMISGADENGDRVMSLQEFQAFMNGDSKAATEELHAVGGTIPIVNLATGGVGVIWPAEEGDFKFKF